MNLDNVGSLTATIGGGFFAGILIGYALKKVVKVVAIVVGLFFAGLAYLPYQHIIDIRWAKLESTSQNAVTTLANATTQIPGLNTTDHTATISNPSIPLTGSLSMGFVIGFIKG